MYLNNDAVPLKFERWNIINITILLHSEFEQKYGGSTCLLQRLLANSLNEIDDFIEVRSLK